MGKFAVPELLSPDLEENEEIQPVSSLRTLHKAGRSNPVFNFNHVLKKSVCFPWISKLFAEAYNEKCFTGLLRPALCKVRNDDRGQGGRRLSILILISILFTSPASAETSREAIMQVKKQKEALIQEQKRLMTEVKTIEDMLEKLSFESEDNQKKLIQHQEDISKTLPLLARLERSNPLRMLVDPTTGQDKVRGIILTRFLVSSLKRKMQEVQMALNEIMAQSHALEVNHGTTQQLLQDIEKKKAALSLVELKKIKDWTKAEEERIDRNLDDNALLEESRDTMSKTNREASKATALQGLPFRKLQFPVSGKIIKDVELQNRFSPHSQGVFFEAQKNAHVCAPAKGTIVFKGPFRTHKEILIIDHGEKVHTILMGVHKINADVGKKVYAGEKLGMMAGYGVGLPKLYLELRSKGKSIDPTPYFVSK